MYSVISKTDIVLQFIVIIALYFCIIKSDILFGTWNCQNWELRNDFFIQYFSLLTKRKELCTGFVISMVSSGHCAGIY